MLGRVTIEPVPVPADCTVQDEVAQVVERAVDRFGRIDTYVANAIVTVYAETYRYEADELRRIMDVNFFGQVYGYWAVLPHLRESRGTFVSIQSALASVGALNCSFISRLEPKSSASPASVISKGERTASSRMSTLNGVKTKRRTEAGT